MITLSRVYHKHYTEGTLTLPNGDILKVLELPWRNNEIGKSCIPEGQYIVDRNKTGRHQWYAFRNEETDPRTFIEIHPASLLNHLEGCLAPCYEIKGGERTSDPVAVRSKEACEVLLDWFGDDSWVLQIVSN